MKRAWLDILIDPAPTIRRGSSGERDASLGLALLLEVQVGAYRARAADQGWPLLGADYELTDDPPRNLLCGLAAQLAGDARAIEIYESVSIDDRAERDLRTVAVILASIALTDNAQAAIAVARLREASEDARTPEDRALLLLHLGFRLGEVGQFEEAVEVTRTASEAAREAKRGGNVRQVLRVVAAHNRWHFEQRLGLRTSPFKLPARSAVPTLTRVDVLVEQALASFFDRQFDATLEDPNTRTVRFAAFDDVEAGLLGGLLRAEALADWSQTMQLRRYLGRYEVVSKVGLPDRSFDAALDLLTRSGDEKSVERSAWLVGRLGPLESLRTAARASLTRGSTPQTEQADLRLLQYSADVLEVDEAGRAVEWILASEALRRVPQIAAPALSNLLAVAPRTSHRSVAADVLTLAQTETDLLLLQSIASIPYALDWELLTIAERRKWISFIRKNVVSDTSRSFVAQAAASTLGRSLPSEIARIVTGCIEREPRLDLAAILVNIDADVDRPIWQALLEVATKALDKTRADAQAGSYSFGALNVAALSVEILRREPNRAAWTSLSDFLLDPRVGANEKTDALTRLRDPGVKMPPGTAKTLRSGLPDLPAQLDPLGPAFETYEAARLRLAIRLNVIDAANLLARLARLAANQSAVSRIAASTVIPESGRIVTDEALVPLALLLAADRDPDVRAQAAYALAIIAPAAGPFASPTQDRLLELLDEPSLRIPAATIAGLAARLREGNTVSPQLNAAARRLSKRHLSNQVRTNAAVLMGRLDG